MTMTRSERERMARLDSALRRLDTAEQRAIEEIRAAGFNVRGIDTARRIQTTYREATRQHAEAVERMHDIATGRKTA